MDDAAATSASRRLHLAVMNNVAWCEAVSRTHLFVKRIEASWLWRSAEPIESPQEDDLDWRWVETPLDLAKWELAWSAGEPADRHCRLFAPALLAAPAGSFADVRLAGEDFARMPVTSSRQRTELLRAIEAVPGAPWRPDCCRQAIHWAHASSVAKVA